MTTYWLYCPTCRTHTDHVQLFNMFATRCLTCHTQTSQLERSHVENITFTAPDGVTTRVVHNTPELVTFYVPDGQYEGYYYYDKHTGKRTTASGRPLPKKYH